MLLFDIKQEIAINGVCGSLTLKLENDHAIVMTRGEQTERGMRGDHPIAIVFTSERVQTGAFGHVPHANRLVLRVAHNQLLLGVKYHA